MKPLRICIALMLIATCATVPSRENVITKEEKVSSGPKEKPGWVTEEPEAKGGKYFFVGLSGYTTIERNGRDEAYSHAVKMAAKFMGTEYLEESKTITTGYGLSSDIYNPAVARKGIEEQLTKAITRRIKARQYYVEKWKRYYEESAPEIFYKVWVLVDVPVNIVEEEISRLKKEQKVIAKKIKEISGNIDSAQTLINTAGNLSASKPCRAYMNYSSAKKIADSAGTALECISAVGIYRLEELINSVRKKAIAGMDKLTENPEAVLECAVIGLAANYSKKKPVNVAVAKVVYKDTELSTDFTRYLTGKIEEYMASDNTVYSVVSRRDFGKILMRRNSSIEDCLSGKSGLKIDALVYASYLVLESGDIELKLELKEVGSRKLLDKESLNVPKSLFADSIEYIPDAEALESWREFSSLSRDKNFRVKIYPERGESAVYYKDELLRFKIKSNKSCYIYVYYVDAGGGITMIFPNPYNSSNRITANRVYTIPQPGTGFKLKVQCPFGSEIIKVFATLKPVETGNTAKSFIQFKNLDSYRGSDGARRIRVLPENTKAEDVCAVRTIMTEQ